MGDSTVLTYVKIRRFDIKARPDLQPTTLEFKTNLPYSNLKTEVQNYFNIAEGDDKVIKLRNKDLIIIPLIHLLDGNSPENYLVIDVSNIQRSAKSTVNLQDAYLDAVCHKLHSMESRVAEAEQLMPQIQMKRQAYMDEVVENMSTRVAFLNKRVDDVVPAQWKSKLPVTIS